MRKLLVLLPMLLMNRCATTLPELQPFDRVELRDNQNRPRGRLTDAQQLARLRTFIEARRKGWQVPFAGVPVPTLIADLYAGKEFVGHFGAGANFFECQREGGFYSRRAEEAELREFRELVGE